MKLNTFNHNIPLIFLFLASSLMLVSCNKDEDNPAGPGANEELYNEFEALTSQVVTETKLPGMVVGVWAPGNSVEWVKAEGYSEVSASTTMKTTDLFRIGSITKTFVGTVLLQLFDEGKVGLDDKLSKYFPNYPNGGNITIRQLSNMTSGIYNYSESDEFLNSMISQPTRVYEPQELIDIAKDKTPYFEPGHGYYYSNTNYILLGLIIEQITGNTLENEIKNRILVPLQLNNTYFPSDRLMPGVFAHGYETMDGTTAIDVSEVFDPSWAWAAGAMISDLHDLKIWVEALAKGTLISANAQKERLTYVLTDDITNYGIGLFELIGFIGHNGGLPGYLTYCAYSPEKNTTIIVLFNSSYQSDPTFLGARLAIKMYPELAEDLEKSGCLVNNQQQGLLKLR